MEHLMYTLQRLHASWAPHVRPFAPRFGAEVYGVAMETRTVSDQYHWHSLKRSSDPAHPFIVFQYTLSGWGCYAEGETVHKITPRMAFTALVPSDSRYYLPPESPHWTFCWLIILHPYIVHRVTQRLESVGAVLHLTPGSMLIARVLQLLEGTYSETFHDTFAEEQALFDFLVEYERVAYHIRYSQNERDRLLNEVRALVLECLQQPIEVERIAARYEMSRSHFSHHFKSKTGLAPAQFVTQVRLEEAVQRLLHSSLNLEEIACATGFANANHFCKVFRRHYHQSPGAFRHQMHVMAQPIAPCLPVESWPQEGVVQAAE